MKTETIRRLFRKLVKIKYTTNDAVVFCKANNQLSKIVNIGYHIFYNTGDWEVLLYKRKGVKIGKEPIEVVDIAYTKQQKTFKKKILLYRKKKRKEYLKTDSKKEVDLFISKRNKLMKHLSKG